MSNVCKCGHSEENHSLMRGVRRCEGTTSEPCACEGYAPESAAKHTSGPYTLVTKFAHDGDVYGDAEIHAPLRYPLIELEICDEETRANAYLFTAAPELYVAANEAVELLLGGYTTRDGYEYHHSDVRTALDMLRAAIAKAEVRP